MLKDLSSGIYSTILSCPLRQSYGLDLELELELLGTSWKDADTSGNPIEYLEKVADSEAKFLVPDSWQPMC